AYSSWDILIAFTVATLFLFLLLKTVRGSRLFEALFVFAVFLGMGSLVSALFGQGWAILVTAAAVFLYYREPRVITHNLIVAGGTAGVVASVGSAINPMSVLIVLAVLAVYDLVAVYGTKHMVVMAETLVRHKVFFGMILPERPRGLLALRRQVDLKHGVSFLGTGDVALPCLLLAAAAARYGTVPTLPILVGALAGLVATDLLFFRQSQKRPMAALPPISLGSILGYAVTLFAFG
ncbi:hypothetical protein AMJ57_02020, partial [Parcubacteria bacterium SG8_24]